MSNVTKMYFTRSNRAPDCAISPDDTTDHGTAQLVTCHLDVALLQCETRIRFSMSARLGVHPQPVNTGVRSSRDANADVSPRGQEVKGALKATAGSI